MSNLKIRIGTDMGFFIEILVLFWILRLFAKKPEQNITITIALEGNKKPDLRLIKRED